MASGLSAVILDVMDSAQLPGDINEIVDYLAMIARGYSGKMQWQEVAKLKSDMIVGRERWTKARAPVDAVKAKCLDSGMTAEDTETIVDLLHRVQAGKRFVPQGSYRRSRFRFSPPVE
jgi:hypothetical protein